MGWGWVGGVYGLETTLLYMKRRNKTQSQTFVLLWFLCFQRQPFRFPLRKHAYSNILKKKENFQIKKSDIFHISAQNID